MQCFILLKQVVKRRVAKDESDRKLRMFRCPVHAYTERDERSGMDPMGSMDLEYIYK